MDIGVSCRAAVDAVRIWRYGNFIGIILNPVRFIIHVCIICIYAVIEGCDKNDIFKSDIWNIDIPDNHWLSDDLIVGCMIKVNPKSVFIYIIGIQGGFIWIPTRPSLIVMLGPYILGNTGA